VGCGLFTEFSAPQQKRKKERKKEVTNNQDMEKGRERRMEERTTSRCQSLVVVSFSPFTHWLTK